MPPAGAYAGRVTQPWPVVAVPVQGALRLAVMARPLPHLR